MRGLIRFAAILALGSFTAASCKNEPPPIPLDGKWSATALMVSDSLWDVETSPVSLDLGGDGRYNLQWYGNRSETGNWHVDHPHLVIRPKAQESRALEILHISADSLSLRGKVSDKPTILAFKRHVGNED